MIKEHTHKKAKHAFTLTELTVVTTIAALLILLLIPACQVSSNRYKNNRIIQMKSNGKNLYTLVMADALMDHDVGFPDKQTTTTEFFKDLAGVGPANTNMVLKATPEFLLGYWMENAATRFAGLTSEHHGWRVASGQSKTTEAGTTFMVSKNFLPNHIPPANMNIVEEKTLAELEGYQDRILVVAHHGGGARSIRASTGKYMELNHSGNDVYLLPE